MKYVIKSYTKSTFAKFGVYIYKTYLVFSDNNNFYMAHIYIVIYLKILTSWSSKLRRMISIVLTHIPPPSKIDSTSITRFPLKFCYIICFSICKIMICKCICMCVQILGFLIWIFDNTSSNTTNQSRNPRRRGYKGLALLLLFFLDARACAQFVPSDANMSYVTMVNDMLLHLMHMY